MQNENENKKAEIIQSYLKAEERSSLGRLRKYKNANYIFNTEQVFFFKTSVSGKHFKIISFLK